MGPGNTGQHKALRTAQLHVFSLTGLALRSLVLCRKHQAYSTNQKLLPKCVLKSCNFGSHQALLHIGRKVKEHTHSKSAAA